MRLPWWRLELLELEQVRVLLLLAKQRVLPIIKINNEIFIICAKFEVTPVTINTIFYHLKIPLTYSLFLITQQYFLLIMFFIYNDINTQLYYRKVISPLSNLCNLLRCCMNPVSVLFNIQIGSEPFTSFCVKILYLIVFSSEGSIWSTPQFTLYFVNYRLFFYWFLFKF